MAEYTLTLTAAEIDIALNRVNNPDLAPLLNSGELVTSGGVKNYVDTQVSALSNTVDTVFASTNVQTSKSDFTAGVATNTYTYSSFGAVQANETNDSNRTLTISGSSAVAPSSGLSLVSYYATIVDNDSDVYDNYEVLVLINGTYADQLQTGRYFSSGVANTYGLIVNPSTTGTYVLQGSAILAPNSTIQFRTITRSGANTGQFSCSGNVTVLNFNL
jgi:hypothetical protein